MRITTCHFPKRRLSIVASAVALACVIPAPGWGADTDIYGPPKTGGGGPNVVFLLDNTSNWSANNQAWKKADVLAKCSTKPDDQQALCENYVSQVFGAAADLTQGQVQLRALKLVLNELVCNAGTAALNVNVGLSLISKQSTLNNGHPVGVINFAVQSLVGPSATLGTSCNKIVAQLDLIDSKIQDPAWKAPSDANYGAAYYEIFKYLGGHSNPTLAGNPDPNGGSPVGDTGYGTLRFSKKNDLDDPAAFKTSTRADYKSPLSGAASCGANYIVLVGNTYPNAEPKSNGGPVIFSGINYTPPALSTITSDTSRLADEWSYFMANTDVADAPGQQRVFSYAINTYNDKPDADQGKLLKSMAAVGGIGASAYLEVGGDLLALINAFKNILYNIASVNSVFTATTLPVSTTTQGTFLNQVFVGMFRPDAKAGPRWVGNLKQYQLGMVGSSLALVDKNGNSATLGGAGFFAPGAESFWSEPSVFFDQLPSGTPASASDLPDGAIVEKGGAAYQLRKTYLGSTTANTAANRNVKTLVSGALVDFTALTAPAPTDAATAAWVRGMNNVASTDPGAEDFNGSYVNAGTTTVLGATGARHSIHGDVLHSRPVALNYGASGVVVYYGANDGFFRAVDGRKTGSTAGQELWSFIAPEHHDIFERLRSGTPLIHLPETDSAGGAVVASVGTEPKSYAMDGPIGVYAKYNTSTPPSVTEAFIYPTMRRGGRSVYAFDVSSATAPTFKWRIEGGVTSGFDKLAQTWSMPKAVVFKSSTTTPAPMLIMGGGYDPAEDTNSSSGIGNRIYIINGGDGTRIKAMETAYSVPSDVTVVDVNGDGQPDRGYVADVRGNLYRIDFPTTDPLDAASWADVQAVKIANVGGKVFFPPDVVVTKRFVAVMVGTGDREKPLMISTTDHFVMVKDTVGAPRGDALALADLAHIGSVDNATMNVVPMTVSPDSKANGCYLSLATNGEKVVNTPFTIAGATYFGTNRPTPTSASVCSADLGEAYAYKFPLFCEVPAKPSQILGGGLPPSPVGGIVTIDIGGVPTQVPFLIGGSGPSTFDVNEPKPPIPPIRTRQTWRIDNSNR